ncbi:MAG: Zn-dependent alcohol dehydrogenase [Thermomicrobiales bacterium]|nr:Zn-dependent alcohol dehydrogenase [Thermomicrobiales bacterium]
MAESTAGNQPIVARGAIARTPGQPATIEEFTIDAPGPGEALVRILASGVCHTDLSAKNGVFGTEGFPFLLGHEGAGVVEQVGEGVENVTPGDHVILAWRAPCGQCRFCAAGQPHLCAASLNAEKRMRTMQGETLTPVLGIGTFCTHTLVHAKQCIPYDAALPPEQMSLIGCGVMTGVGAALYTAGVRPGSSVAVFGCGGVGDSVIQGAKLAGATKIIAVDVDPKKLEWAKEFGATDVVNASESDPVEQIKALTDGYGVNYAFEAVGRPDTTLQAILSRDLAGTCVMIGVAGPTATLDQLPLGKFFDLGGSLRVSWYGDCLPTRDFPLLATWYEQGRLDLDRVVTRTISLDEVEEGFHAMERGETLRSVITF